MRSLSKRQKKINDSCTKCGLYNYLCICPYTQSIHTKSPVTFVVYKKEYSKASNTARIANTCLSNSKLLIHGVKGETTNYDQILHPDKQNVLLFPFSGARPLSSLDQTQDTHLIIPDGNWKQARKIAKNMLLQGGVVSAKLTESYGGNYQVRRHPDPERICTFEAAYYALRELGEDERLEHLYDAFLKFRNVHLSLRGQKIEPIAETDLTSQS